ncbi:MAG: hypothetical protein ACUVRK_13295, partial [Spirochaetota bacterium]
MKKPKIASVRPSPLSSVGVIVGAIALLIFALSFMPDMSSDGPAMLFFFIYILFGLVMIVYSIVNIISFFKSKT